MQEEHIIKDILNIKKFKKNGKWITKYYIEYKEKIFVAAESKIKKYLSILISVKSTDLFLKYSRISWNKTAKMIQ